MPLEVRKNDGKVITGIMRADNVIRDVLASLDRQAHFTFGIHNVYGGNGGKAVVFGSLQVFLRVRTPTPVSRVALYDGAIYQLYQVFNQSRLQEIVSAGFAGR